jgi:arabinan endo-1,5-alpha-L-arabinosidase
MPTADATGVQRLPIYPMVLSRHPARSLIWTAVFTVTAVIAALITFVRAQAPARAVTGPTRSVMADPDVFFDEANNGFVTLGTTTFDSCGWYNVPYIWTPGPTMDLNDRCADGDLMPSGPGDWAEGPVWAPSLSYFNGTYFLHYTATQRGTGDPGHKCIGRAVSDNARGPFVFQGEVACPPDGRWAIDPDVLPAVSSGYMSFRDDAASSGSETGISIVQLDGNGFGVWSTRRTALTSTAVGWDDFKDSGHVRGLVENPTLIGTGLGRNNHWYLFFSGNRWDSSDYATGVADCGTAILGAGGCKVLGDATRPYFGYSGRASGVQYTLPQDRPGSGGMSVFNIGSNWGAAWHYFDPNGRHTLAGDAFFNGKWKIA